MTDGLSHRVNFYASRPCLVQDCPVISRTGKTVTARQPAAGVPRPDADLSEALAVVDLAELGSRLKQARVALGRTQGEVTAGLVSTAYLSRIEAGTRRPTLDVVTGLAGRLGTTVHELLLGLTPSSWSAKQVELDWAQLSLRTGDAPAALARTTGLLAEVPLGSRFHRAVLSVHALALEATGDYEQAARWLEEVTERIDGAPALENLQALCRVYRLAGELARAIEVGERAERHVAELGLEGTPEAVKLTLTVAAAHTEAGSYGYAARMCQRALEHAESLRTPGEKAGCYWNASIIESKRGNHAEAVAMGHRALAMLDAIEEAKMTSRLRSQLGVMQLRMEDPPVEEALAHLEQGENELRTTDAGSAEIARNRLAQARAHFLVSDFDRATAIAEECLADLPSSAPIHRAEAYGMLGQVAFHEGDGARAQELYGQAILALSAAGADRSAAQLWFELGGLWLSVGCHAQALDAFQRAGVSTGLRAVDPIRPLAPITQKVG